MDELYEQMQLEVLPVESTPVATDESQSQAQPEAVQATGSPAVYEDFGCCSRYHQCSDAKACLIPDRAYSKSCIYRKSLEAGTIFYGKNATAYDAKKYQFFLDKYSSLRPADASVLRNFLHYFYVKKNGVQSAMFLDTPEMFSLADSGFFELAVYPAKIVNKCRMSALMDACGDRFSEAVSWAKAKCPPEKWEKRKGRKIYRDELAHWILKFDPIAVAKLCEGIHFVNIKPDSRLELYEFFFDHIYQDGYIPILTSCEDDPRFLSPGKD